ncbi:hypothetical protein JCM8202_001495 [Rhodotorula sphaerocarpa]
MVADELPGTGSTAPLRPAYLAAFMLLFGCLLTLLTHRIAAWRRKTSMSSVQILTLALLAVSVLFVFVALIMVVGSGPALAASLCSASIWLCIVLYSASKLLVYLVLLERLYIVHGSSATGRQTRWRSPFYVGGALLLVAWAVMVILIIPWKAARLQPETGGCVLSLRLWTLYSSLSMDLVANLYLSAAFIVPVSRCRSPEARRLAHVSMLATLAALLVTIGNAIVLAVLHGKERMFVCLGICALDITANAFIVFLVTMPPRRSDRDLQHPIAGTLDPDAALEVRERQGLGRWRAMTLQLKGAGPKRAGGWYRTSMPASSHGRIDLSSISVEVYEEVRVEDEDERSAEAGDLGAQTLSAGRMPRIPERARSLHGPAFATRPASSARHHRRMSSLTGSAAELYRQREDPENAAEQQGGDTAESGDSKLDLKDCSGLM